MDIRIEKSVKELETELNNKRESINKANAVHLIITIVCSIMTIVCITVFLTKETRVYQLDFVFWLKYFLLSTGSILAIASIIYFGFGRVRFDISEYDDVILLVRIKNNISSARVIDDFYVEVNANNQIYLFKPHVVYFGCEETSLIINADNLIILYNQSVNPTALTVKNVK